MSRRGKRLREFEKNNRVFNISEAQRERQERRKSKKKKNAGNAAEEQFFDIKTNSEKRNKKKNKIVNVKRFAACVIILVFVTSIGISAVKIFQLNGERNRLLEKNEELIRLKEDLTAEMEQINSAEYIERQARKELKMIKSGEILFLVSDENKKSEETAEKEAE